MLPVSWALPTWFFAGTDGGKPGASGSAWLAEAWPKAASATKPTSNINKQQQGCAEYANFNRSPISRPV
jgi:hypothetical protein